MKALRAPVVDYYHFAFDEWAPGRVKFCLMHWTVLEEAAHNGVESADWPPAIGGEAIAVTYPKNMSILTTAADMQIALRKLPPEQAVAVWAYYRFGWTQEEVGRHMDCSQPTAYRHIKRGEAGLIDILCGAGE